MGTDSSMSQLLNNVSEKCVFVESGSRGEGLSTLWTAADFPLVLLFPEAFNAVQAVVVSTRNGHGVSQKVHADGTAELFLVDINTSVFFCHILQFELKNTENKTNYTTVMWGRERVVRLCLVFAYEVVMGGANLLLCVTVGVFQTNPRL